MLTPRRIFIALISIAVLVVLFHALPASSKIPSTFRTDQAPRRSYPPPRDFDRNNQNVIQDMSSKPLRERLRYYFPYDMEQKFPAYIWQTWKSNPSSGDFAEKLRRKEASWTELNPGFVHEVIVDNAAEHLIRYLFASVPEVVEAYSAMPLAVLKADFFRYLILLARGGIYSDIDTTALAPAIDWLPAKFDQSSVGLVVGIEADPDREDWAQWYARRIQFCQWTIQAKPGHPVLREIVASIAEQALSMKQKGQLKPGTEPVVKTIMEFTGPGVWTDSVFAYFNNREYFDLSARGGRTNVTPSDFFNLKEHKKLGDVVVLPITSFSPGVGQMNAGDIDDPMAFVHHDFEGSWKPAAERMNEDRADLDIRKLQKEKQKQHKQEE